MVSVCVLSYNHEKYLRDCLEGIVMQRTMFPIEAWVHDDASTDSSQEIIKEYQNRYPDIIKPILQTENQYSKKEGSILKRFVFPKCIGKYIALCEGDDYWIDPNKLQKQVDYLENHPDFSMCCHGADVKNETPRHIDSACEHMDTREYFSEDAFPTWQIPTASIVYRRDSVDGIELKHSEQFVAGDVVLILKCMHVGRVWGMAEHMSVYRMNPGGATSHVNSHEDKLRLCKHYEALMENFPKIDADYCHRYIAMIHYTNYRQSKDVKDKIKSLLKALKSKPSFVVRKLLKLPIKPRKDLFYQYYGC